MPVWKKANLLAQGWSRRVHAVWAGCTTALPEKILGFSKLEPERELLSFLDHGFRSGRGWKWLCCLSQRGGKAQRWGEWVVGEREGREEVDGN